MRQHLGEIAFVAALVLGGVAVIVATGERLPVMIGWGVLLLGVVVGIWLVWTSVPGNLRYPISGLGLIILVVLVVVAGQSLSAGLEFESHIGIQLKTEAASPLGDVSEPIEAGGFYFIFPNVRITNRGFEPMALSAHMTIEWRDGLLTGHSPTLQRLPVDQLVPGPSPFQVDPPLEFPLNLAPKTSVQGSIGFLISREELDYFGGRDIATGGWAFLYLVDLVSGKETLVWGN